MMRTRTLSEIALAISTDLLRGQREAARRVSHVESDAELGEDRFGLAKHLPPVDHGAAVLVADENVLGDVEIGKQQRLLIDGGDAQCAAPRRRCAIVTGRPARRIWPRSG